MAHGIRDARNNSTTNRRGSQTTASSDGTASTASVVRMSRCALPPQTEEPKTRERKPGAQTKFRQPKQGRKVVLRPSGDMQFSYVNFKSAYKYISQLEIIIKREYPGLIEDKDENGRVIEKRATMDWADYFLNPNDSQRLFEVAREDQDEADRVLDNYLKKKVRDIMYQARVDCVKKHYRDIGEPLDDIQARPILLEYQQYLNAKLNWFDDEEALFGPEKARRINTYAVMKSGIKKCGC
ncbi:hypothetical protein U9M48_043730 [Paspalum notatum var. saurae]|uniref:Uncharacterized protein n=1 Tax=Paspalum notatum var. saurae TaxID=547442 RepID=A0AAQ3UTJ7_PASNO